MRKMLGSDVVMMSSDVDVPSERLATRIEPSGRGKLKYFLLALLVEPRHGYDLWGQWESLLGDVWPLNSSQIYTTLSQMEREELVEAEVVPQELMPPRKVYRLTSEGRETLSSWLYEAVAATQQVRDDFILKVLFAMSPAVAAEFPPLEAIMRHRAACVRSLKELQEVHATVVDSTSQLLIEAAMIRIEGNLRWLELCEEKIQATR